MAKDGGGAGWTLFGLALIGAAGYAIYSALTITPAQAAAAVPPGPLKDMGPKYQAFYTQFNQAAADFHAGRITAGEFASKLDQIRKDVLASHAAGELTDFDVAALTERIVMLKNG